MTDVRRAGVQDAGALADLLAASPQTGAMTLAQHRPDVFARRAPYPSACTFAVDDDAGIAATATVALKRVRVAGGEREVGYVFDVAVADRARRRGLAARVLAAARQWAGERDAALLYANVMVGNAPSERLFRVNGYDVGARLAGRVFAVWRRRTPLAGAAPLEDWEAAARLRTSTWGDHELFRALDTTELRAHWTSLPGWDPALAWQTSGAVVGLWDYRQVIQSVPLTLPPFTRALGAVSRGAHAVRIPFPRPPRLGERQPYGILLGLAGEPREQRVLVIHALAAARARGLDVVLGFHDHRERPPWARAGLSVRDDYHVMVQPLGTGPGSSLGAGRVWVDPVDL